MTTLRFHTLDVFTDRRFGGNPLAVVFGGDRLPDATMQAIARELNLSETVFVLPPTNSEATHRVRIFTPADVGEGAVRAVRVGGAAVPVSQDTLHADGP